MESRCWFILHLRVCRRLALWGLAYVLAVSLMPHAAQARQTLPPKFKIDGTTLIYDTDNLVAQEVDGTQHAETGEISDDDIEPFRDILDANPAITRLQLNSGGGSVYAGESIADIVQDHALDTWVVGECISACVDIFLAKQSTSDDPRVEDWLSSARLGTESGAELLSPVAQGRKLGHTV
ncbi:hypothetical protein L0Z64_15790 [Phaeobacter sp. BS23]|uniref:hypothetical protein n=1 Tax=Phaeobacter sp. BS23 TaxID=2907239 RepID=UPI00386480A1